MTGHVTFPEKRSETCCNVHSREITAFMTDKTICSREKMRCISPFLMRPLFVVAVTSFVD